MASDIVVAIDGGTESVRVGLVCCATGALVSSAAAPYTTATPANGWAEQRGEDWLRALGEASRQCTNVLRMFFLVGRHAVRCALYGVKTLPGMCVRACYPCPCILGLCSGEVHLGSGDTSHCPTTHYTAYGTHGWWRVARNTTAVNAGMAGATVAPDRIKALSFVTTTCTLLPVGADGQPLCPALLWSDVRATEQADRIFATGHPAVTRVSGAGFSVRKRYRAAARVWAHVPCECACAGMCGREAGAVLESRSCLARQLLVVVVVVCGRVCTHACECASCSHLLDVGFDSSGRRN